MIHTPGILAAQTPVARAPGGTWRLLEHRRSRKFTETRHEAGSAPQQVRGNNVSGPCAQSAKRWTVDAIRDATPRAAQLPQKPAP